MSYINTLTTGTGTLTYYSDVTGNLQLQTDGNILIGMTNSATGRLVGIGTSTPAYNLDVVGNVRISGNLTVNGSNGFAFSDGTVQTSAASPYVLKNRIINGDMRIDQRNAGASVTLTSSNGVFVVDRWTFYNSIGTLTGQQNAGSVTPPAGFTNYVGYTVTAAATPSGSNFVSIQQKIEGYNIADLAYGTANAKTVTLSFWVYCSKTGTFGGALQNQSNSYSYAFTYSIPSANIWAFITVTIPGLTTGAQNTTNGTGLFVVLDLGNGASLNTTPGSWVVGSYQGATGSSNIVSTSGAYYYLTGVQLEIGTSATPFERRMYGQELANCQRYYTQSYDYGNVAGTIQRIGAITTVAPAAQNFLQLGQSAFPVSMRTTPAITLYNPDTGSSNITLAIRNYTGSSNLSASVATVSSTSLRVTLNNVASTTDSVYGVHYTASAEL